MARALVQIHKSDGRWYWDCRRCLDREVSDDYRDITKAAHRHLARHVDAGFSPPTR